MEFKVIQIEDIQHEHPLILEDLQSMYQNYQEDDDDFDDLDLITVQNYKSKCDICDIRIDWYHRYYYKCREPSCSYSLHKFCGEMTTTFRFPSHLHTLHLNNRLSPWSCQSCHTEHQEGICYHCSTCDYKIDMRCVAFAEQTKIHHPNHPHPLIYATLDPILSKCYACGKEHKGVFYHCITCFKFSIHVDCVTLPFKFTSNHHVHMVTLSYSISDTPYHVKCWICAMSISEHIWLYKCSKCRYFVHLDCATSRGEPFMAILSHGIRRSNTNINIKAADLLDILHYPLPDESYNTLPYHVVRGNYPHLDQVIFDNGLYKHSSHNHPLLLINEPDTTILGILHNPMMRIKLLCDGCLRPITTTPYYVCNQAASGCKFYLHEWCTRLPSELGNHPGHPEHKFVLFHLPAGDLAYTGFKCNICGLSCNGFGYVCSECDYRVDVNCGFVPERITHEAHPNHLLSRVYASSIHSTLSCNACDVVINGCEICFRCSFCDFYLHTRCALHLHKTIKNKYDKHLLELSYSPIEDHNMEYFCEVCEEVLIPEKWFYHCLECDQSIHSTCAPLILKSEQDVNSVANQEGVYKFVNMRFGDLHTFKGHIHSFSVLAGTKSDGCCYICDSELQSLLIFKCFTCELGLHVECCSWRNRLTKKWRRVESMRMREFYSLDKIYTRIFRGKNRNKYNLFKTVHKRDIAFYPNEVIRPVTGKWKVVDGVLK